ncbi:TonB-dependent siderophore receptor, partial [Xanthomonas hortorum pv. pelargonii]|nr:TonB-dependent siderophore receptor [Xanthomonas hortorum pv. pelargonii]
MPAISAPLATLSAALLCALAMTPCAAHAADAADLTNAKTLDQVNVNGAVSRAQPATTTRLPLTLQETPQSVSVIGLQ